MQPIAIYSDFDGTIFLQDTGHVLFDRFGCGPEAREALDSAIGETKTFRQASEELWSSLDVTLDEGLKTLREHLVLDPGFPKFMEWTMAHNVPFTVISAGIRPLLRGALDTIVGKEISEHIDIISNDANISDCGSSWVPVWRHDCDLGHDKAQSIREVREADPDRVIVFIGDGVSDLPAARNADLLFARRGLKLEKYCQDHGIAYVPYDSFADIERYLDDYVAGNPYHSSPLESPLSSVSLSSEGESDGPITPVSSLSPMSWPRSTEKVKSQTQRPMVMRTRSGLTQKPTPYAKPSLVL